MSRLEKNQRGFTIIEILIVMTVLGLLIALGSQIVQFHVTHISLDTLTQQIIADIKNQQIAAMSGQTPEGGEYVDYSIRFEATRYILYPGIVYDPANPENTVVPLADGYIFSDITVPNSEISFSRLSGDVRNFTLGQNSLALEFAQTHEKRSMSLNRHAVVNVQ